MSEKCVFVFTYIANYFFIYMCIYDYFCIYKYLLTTKMQLISIDKKIYYFGFMVFASFLLLVKAPNLYQVLCVYFF